MPPDVSLLGWSALGVGGGGPATLGSGAEPDIQSALSLQDSQLWPLTSKSLQLAMPFSNPTPPTWSLFWR